MGSTRGRLNRKIVHQAQVDNIHGDFRVEAGLERFPYIILVKCAGTTLSACLDVNFTILRSKAFYRATFGEGDSK